MSFAAACVIAMTLAGWPAQAQTAAPSQSAAQPEEQPKGKSFSSPDDAAAALYAAARRDDEAALLVILGPGAKELIMWSDDPNERRIEHEDFAQKYDRMHRLVKEPDHTVALYVGAENWPLPIPLVQYKGAWYFEAELGKQEVLYRRVGRNEMEALEVCHALVDAEKEYYSTAHHYTQKFMSSSDSHDGLYWNGTDASKQSFIGPHLAHAGMTESGGQNLRPFHGYYYRILLQGSSMGSSTSGGQNAAASGGFAVLASPAAYRSSGVMTFIMDADGNASEKDLGPSTSDLSKQIASYTPDNTWKKVQ
jgi:hypothetical protein